MSLERRCAGQRPHPESTSLGPTFVNLGSLFESLDDMRNERHLPINRQTEEANFANLLVSSVSHHALSKAPYISSYAASLAVHRVPLGHPINILSMVFPSTGAGLWASKTLEGHSHPCPASISLMAAAFQTRVKYSNSRHLFTIARNKPRSRKITAWHMSDVNYQCLELFKNVMPLKTGRPGKSLEVTDG
ncbi:hypothetical protein EVAR_8396_1 [Eumeta japonica]|uniref:Uncharacterized protein n=1 Tax=Eumeta variegata TaxID=151549 RepID=A0A4C2AD84_EUMVA|nr:hypothetical protein EVAR_8396_1 [Eumeta japonica]